MKIAVLAADGRSGREFVRLALAAGHSVRAGVHGASPFTPDDHLTAVTCDAAKPADISRLIRGQEAVVSLIGHVKGSNKDIQTIAIRNLIHAMRLEHLKRIVSLTGTGVRFPNDIIPPIDYLLNGAITLIDPDRVHDGRRHAELLQASNLDWTIIRVLKLQNTKPHPFRLTEHGPTKVITSRTEVGQAILQVLAESSFIRQAPIISQA